MQRQVVFPFIFFIVLSFCSSPASAKQYWTQRAGGVTIDQAADISIDGAGNFYATGYFTGKSTFGSSTLCSQT